MKNFIPHLKRIRFNKEMIGGLKRCRIRLATNPRSA